MPNAKQRAKGVKFACPGCQANGKDRSQDNGFVGFDGTIGCAVADEHNAAIRKALGVSSARRFTVD